MPQSAYINATPPDDPYADILVKVGTLTVARFPLDDAPVRDWNYRQKRIAEHLVDQLNATPELLQYYV